jgi:hypothetical protein
LYFAAQLIFMRIATGKRLLILGLIVFFVSCQKEVNLQNQGGSGGGTGSGGTNSIIGDYDFVGMTAHTNSTVSVATMGQQLKTITVSDYTSESNAGAVKITSNQFISTGLAYSIDTIMNVKTYIDNVLFDDADLPFTASVPPTSSTSPYVRNTADSITVTGAFGVPDPSGGAPTGPVGIKLSWSGDTLLLKVATTVTQSISQGGIPGTFTGTVNGVTKLKKH